MAIENRICLKWNKRSADEAGGGYQNRAYSIDFPVHSAHCEYQTLEKY